MAAPDELLCPGCKDPFSLNKKIPKTLQCLHTFCVDCLQIEQTEEEKPFVLCPAPPCGTRHFLDPDKDLKSGLKTDYFIQRASSRFQVLTRAETRCDTCSEPDNDAIIYCDSCRKFFCLFCSKFHKRNIDTRFHPVVDAKKLLQEPSSIGVDDPLVPFVTSKKWKCEDHSENEEVEDVCIYCLSCSTMICSICAMGVHSQHTLRPAIQVLKSKENSDYQYEQQLQALEQARNDYAAAIDSTDVQIEELDGAWRLAGEAIEKTVRDLQQQLLVERDTLMKKVKRIHDTRVTEITKDLKSFEKLRIDISHSITYVNNRLMCVAEDILEEEQGMLERLEQLRHEFYELPDKPSQRDVFVLTMDPVDLSDEVGHVYTNAEPSSLVKGIDQVPLVQGKKAEFHLICRDSIGSHLPSTDFEVAPVEVRPAAEMFSLRNNLDGTYTVSFKPRSSGEHVLRLEVQNKGIAIPLDPVTVTVSPILLEEAQVTKQIMCEDIPEMISPAGIAVHEQNAAIVDKDIHKLFVVTLEGECVKVIGREGEKAGEFNSPEGVDWWDENLVVADTENHRIQVISIDGECLNEFGQLGGRGAEFMKPTDVALSVCEEYTMLYVADPINYRIQFFKMTDFETDGELMGIYKTQNMPYSLCVNGQSQVFVTESHASQFSILSLKHKEQKSDLVQSHGRNTPEPRPKNTCIPELELLCTCTHKESPDEKLLQVQSIAYDSQSQYILVTEQDCPSISVFCRDGTYVGSVPCAEDVKLESIAVCNSCVLAYDSVKQTILVLKLF